MPATYLHAPERLAALTVHPLEPVRGWAAERLYRLYPEAGLAHARAVLADPFRPAEPVREAVRALDAAAWAGLADLLAARLSMSRDAAVVAAAELALLSDPRGRPTLERALSDPGISADVAVAALAGLAAVGGEHPVALAPLASAASIEDLLLHGETWLLAGGPPVVEALLDRALAHGDDGEEEVSVVDGVLADATSTAALDLLLAGEEADPLEVRASYRVLARALGRDALARAADALPVARVTCGRSLALLVEHALAAPPSPRPTPGERCARVLLAAVSARADADGVPARFVRVLAHRVALVAVPLLAPLSAQLPADPAADPDALLRAVLGPEPEVPIAWTRAVRRLPAERALGPLRAAALDRNRGPGRVRALELLGERRDRDSLEPFLAALVGPGLDAAAAACEGLARLGADAAHAVLDRHFHGGHAVLDWPLEVLAAVPTPRVRDHLLSALAAAHGDDVALPALARALALLAAEEATEALGRDLPLDDDPPLAEALLIHAGVCGVPDLARRAEGALRGRQIL